MKFFTSCLVLCVIGMSQAQIQDTPETVAAKAAHFEAVRRAEALIANSPQPTYLPQQPRPAVLETSQHKLGLNVDDTPEVAAAKVAHYEAVREAERATAIANATNREQGSRPIGGHVHSAPTVPIQIHHPAPVHHMTSVHRPSPVKYSIPVQYNNVMVPHTMQHQLGMNVHDTPEVAAAKLAHYNAVRRAEQAAALLAPGDDGSYRVVPTYQAPAPVGPVQLRDAPEVAAAKAAHLEAKRRAEMFAGQRYVDNMRQRVSMTVPIMYQPMPVAYPQVPVVAVPQTNQHKLGVNVHDTPEVAAAKAAHLEAVRRAQMIAPENEEIFSSRFMPSNNYFSHPARNYGQINY